MSNENTEGFFSCPNMCWLIGVLMGVATYLIATGRYGVNMFVAIIIGLVVLVALALLLCRLFCKKTGDYHPHPARREHEIAASASSILAADSNGAMPAAVPAAAKPVTSAEIDPGAAQKPAEKAAPAEAKPLAEETPKADEAAQSPEADDIPAADISKPEMLTEPRAGGADDLKQIKGVGPKLEGVLHGLGVFHFDQVAAWTSDEVKWVDENLTGFKGRVSRDEWVKQAKVLAEGGTTEFSRRVEEGGVYDQDKS